MYKKFLLVPVFILFFVSNLFAQDSYLSKIKKVHDEMLYPVVRVRAGDVGGSGTIVHSKKDSLGKVRTFIITNEHVVDNLIAVDKKWDEVMKAEVLKETMKTVFVEFFKYNNYSHNIGTFLVEGDIVAYSRVDGGQDWALIETRDKEAFAPFVASLYPKDKVDSIYVWDEVYAVGASLLHPPIVTFGHITYMDDEIDNYKFWMSNASIIYGNSGGAVFRYSIERDKYEFIGIPSRISVYGGFTGTTAVSHMGYFVPIYRIYNLLDENCFQFIYNSNYTIEQCVKMREQKKSRTIKLTEQQSLDKR